MVKSKMISIWPKSLYIFWKMISPFLFRKPFSLLPKKKNPTLWLEKKNPDLLHAHSCSSSLSLGQSPSPAHLVSLSLGRASLFYPDAGILISLFLYLNPNLSFYVCVKDIEYFSLWRVFWVAIEGLFGWIIVVSENVLWWHFFLGWVLSVN